MRRNFKRTHPLTHSPNCHYAPFPRFDSESSLADLHARVADVAALHDKLAQLDIELRTHPAYIKKTQGGDGGGGGNGSGGVDFDGQGGMELHGGMAGMADVEMG